MAGKVKTGQRIGENLSGSNESSIGTDAPQSDAAVVRRGPWRTHWKEGVLLLLIVITAFYVRNGRVNQGLPYAIEWDEPFIYQPAFRLLKHNIVRPDSYDYGPMNTYMHAAWGVVGYVRGLSRGLFPDKIWGIRTDLETGWYWSVPHPWLLRNARQLSVLLGLLALMLTYKAGRDLGGPMTGLLGAAMLAVIPVVAVQTSSITPDAPAMAATAAALWASIRVFQTRSWTALAVASAAAAVATGFKYNYLPVVLFPILAWLLSRPGQPSRPATRLLSLPAFTVIGVTFALVGILMILPAFFDVPMFLDSIANVLGFYKAPVSAGSGTRLVRYGQQILAGLGGGSYTNPEAMTFEIWWSGLGLFLVTAAGVLVMLGEQPRIASLLLIPALANLFLVGGNIKNFFPRYLCLSLVPVALLFGLGVTLLFRRLTESPLQRFRWPALAALVVITLLPSTWQSFRNVVLANEKEPRIALAEAMDKSVPEGARILVSEETRWAPAIPNPKKYKLTYMPLPRIITQPPPASDFDYMIIPDSLDWRNPNPLKLEMKKVVNNWLEPLRKRSILAFGSKPVYGGAPTVRPKVALVPYDSQSARRNWIPENEIFGPVFRPVSGTASLGDGVLAIQTASSVVAPVRITKPTSRVILTCNGRNTRIEKEYPEVMFQIQSADIDTTDSIAKKFTIHSYRSGLVDYKEKLSLEPGNYVVQLNFRDPNHFLLFLQSVRFTAEGEP